MAGSDWDLGQKLIDRGFCTLDQVREVISSQERTGDPFVVILVQKGYATSAQLAQLGVAVPARSDRETSAPVRPRTPLWMFAGVVGGVALLLIIGGSLNWFRSSGNRVTDDRGDLSELDRIVAADRDFENAAEVARGYDEFIRKHMGRRSEIEARLALAEYRARCENAARPLMEPILRDEPALLEKKRYGDLLRLYGTFPAKFIEVSDSGREVKEKIAEVRRRLEEDFRRDQGEAARLARAGERGEAMKRIRAIELYAAPEQAAEIAALKRRVTSGLRTEVMDRYYRHVDGPFKAALAARDPRRAAGVVREFVWAPWNEGERPFARVEGVDYDALLKLVDAWDAAAVDAACEAALKDADAPSVGEMALIDLRSAALTALFYRDAAGSTADPIRDLLARAANATGVPEPSRNARAGFFCYYAGKDLHAEAYVHLMKAHLLGVKGLKVFLTNPVAATQAQMERVLDVKLGAAREYLARRQWTPAKSLLEDILKQADHPFVQQNRVEVERLIYDAGRGLKASKELADFYRGRVEQVDAASVRVTYDFEDPFQGGAFEGISEEDQRKFKGRWGVSEGAMESSHLSSALRWIPKVRGDVTVEYDVTPLEDPQNIVLDLYYNRGQARHYAVVLGFDWIGKSEGDPVDAAEERYGMPRTCVVKYPVVADKSRGMLQEEWDKWTRALVGRAAGAWKAERSKTSRIRVERVGPALRLLADRALIWEGEDAAYTEGHLLFYSDCRCRIDNLSITYKP